MRRENACVNSCVVPFSYQNYFWGPQLDIDSEETRGNEGRQSEMVSVMQQRSSARHGPGTLLFIATRVPHNWEVFEYFRRSTES